MILLVGMWCLLFIDGVGLLMSVFRIGEFGVFLWFLCLLKVERFSTNCFLGFVRYCVGKLLGIDHVLKSCCRFSLIGF